MKSFRLESPRRSKARSSKLWKLSEGLADDETRERLIRQAQVKARRLTPTTLRVAIGMVIFIALTLLLAAAIGRQAAPIAIIGLLVIIVITFLDNEGQEEREKYYFSRILKAEGMRPIMCLRCKYNLTGTTSADCPECGEPLAPPKEEQP